MAESNGLGTALADLCDRLLRNTDGETSAYIPELAKADPELCGLALMGTRGRHIKAGHAESPFTMQSVSKPFVYAIALAEHGLDEVTRWVGAEPSGEPFNAISLDRATGRPDNPMINAGAIATTALIPGSPADRFTRIIDGLSAFAGRSLDVDEAVYQQEMSIGDRNRALAYLLRSAGPRRGDPVEAVETYFRQCAVTATALDLAVMATTLANGGVNPVTGARVIPEPVAEQVLAVMASCGMYDASGTWLQRVGLPAKSGISGGLIAVSPGRFGLAAFSPRLDERGNPIRAVLAITELSERFGLHMLHTPATPARWS